MGGARRGTYRGVSYPMNTALKLNLFFFHRARGISHGPDRAETGRRAAVGNELVRCAVRMLTLTSSSRCPLLREPPSMEDVRALRDREWEAHERAYHEF